jgi:phage host-nuclease inhibitor protein Gam
MSKEERKKKWGKAKEWLKTNAPKALDVVGDILPDNGALGVIKNILDKDPDVSPEQQAQFDAMIKEMYELEVRDRESARTREVEVKKAGKQDWMMFITGVVGLASFVFTIYAVVYVENVRENDLFIHLMGMIEGVVIGNIFAYYYGTSSQDRKK